MKGISVPEWTFWLFLYLPLSGFGQTALRVGTIEGRVVDAGTGAPLPGANVSVEHTLLGAAADRDGTFRIPRVPVGGYSLRFTYIGYAAVVKTDVIVRSNRTTGVPVALKMQAVETEAVRVTAGYFSDAGDQPVGGIGFSREEIRRAPGAGGDVSRILFSLPGVSKVNDQSNALCVRGGNPVENAFFIDNIGIPNINHFPDQATSGGPIGLVNVDFIEDVTFLAGGFPAQYGDRLSAVMDITFREGNRKEFDGRIDLNFAGFGGAAEGPLGSTGSWMLSARRSYLDLVIRTIDIGTSVAPRYGDVQGKLVLDLNPRHKLTLLGIYGDDHNAPDQRTARENQMTHFGRQDDAQATLGLNWRALWSRNGYSNTSLSFTGQRFDQDWFETGTALHAIRNRSHERVLRFRNVSHFRLRPGHAVTFGVEAGMHRDTYDNRFGAVTDATGNAVPERSLRGTEHAVSAGGFVSHEIRPVHRLTATTGLRADRYSRTGRIAWSPRASLSFQISKRLSLGCSAGLYHQSLPLLLLSRHPENRRLREMRSTHLLFGFEYLLQPETRLTIEAYHKASARYPLDPGQPGIFILDEGYTFSQAAFTGDGNARADGVEIMVQKKLARRFYGLASASLSRSEYRASDGLWRPRKYDNRVILGIEGGYKPDRNWEFSLRWIYAGGAPYTPLNLESSRQNRRIVLDETRINASRFPDYHAMNIRFDRRFHFARSNLIFYLSVWNVYNRKNVAMMYWNDAEQRQEFIYQWPALPVFGLEFVF
ncbi:MAG TPA: TonB-dependent receptor [bacterium]|nr:TonB-dependent receptor [bacterium]